MFQVGYHARGGVDGFLSHTYVPGLRLRLDDELISESHCRAWTVSGSACGILRAVGEGLPDTSGQRVVADAQEGGAAW